MTNSCSQPYFPAEVVYLAHILVNIDLYANLISYDTKSIKFELMLIAMHYIDLMHKHLSWQTRSTWPTKFGCAIYDWQMIFERNLLSGLSENTLLPSDNKGRVRVKKLHGRPQK